MKSIKLIAIMTMMVTGGMTQADYECLSYDLKESLKVNENYINCGGHTHVLLEGDNYTRNFFGNIVINEGGIQKKKVIEFYNLDGSLTIVQQPIFKPPFCGRGSCDNDSLPTMGKKITAKLSLSEEITKFQCYETSL